MDAHSSHKTMFMDFLLNFNNAQYQEAFEQLLEKQDPMPCRRLVVSFSHLLSHNPSFAAALRSNPSELIPASISALEHLAPSQFTSTTFLLGFTSESSLSPRDLKASFLNSLVDVYGVITKLSPVLFTSESTKSSIFHDVQYATLQETPESAPPGQLPRSLELLLSHDLVNSIKPGDRVCANGILRVTKSSSLILHTTSTASTNSSKIPDSSLRSSLTIQDIQQFKRLAVQNDLLSILASKTCRSMNGLIEVKKAIILMMLGGNELTLKNGTHLRGTINLLLVGDPSTGKSQLLRFIHSLSNTKSILTTGKGSSGVGLTAAVVMDEYLKEKRLEAGAMVLGDRGIVLIDEFDKMGDYDRVAIHEAMEQQSVTISKAGIHTSLNARCSVVAAANPIYGQYDVTLSPMKNIGLSDAILSRFDLLFIILDNISSDKDREISNHVFGFSKDDTISKKEDKQLVEKYLWYAKYKSEQNAPEMTPEVVKLVSFEYSVLRAERGFKSLPVTPRLVESLYRLSTAHAKLRLSQKVERQDAEVAIELVRYSLYHNTESAATRYRKVERSSRKEILKQGVVGLYQKNVEKVLNHGLGLKEVVKEVNQQLEKQNVYLGTEEELVDIAEMAKYVQENKFMRSRFFYAASTQTLYKK